MTYKSWHTACNIPSIRRSPLDRSFKMRTVYTLLTTGGAQLEGLIMSEIKPIKRKGVAIVGHVQDTARVYIASNLLTSGDEKAAQAAQRLKKAGMTGYTEGGDNMRDLSFCVCVLLGRGLSKQERKRLIWLGTVTPPTHNYSPVLSKEDKRTVKHYQKKRKESGYRTYTGKGSGSVAAKVREKARAKMSPDMVAHGDAI